MTGIIKVRFRIRFIYEHIKEMIEAKGVTQWMYETDVEQIRYDYNKASKKER